MYIDVFVAPVNIATLLILSVFHSYDKSCNDHIIKPSIHNTYVFDTLILMELYKKYQLFSHVSV